MLSRSETTFVWAFSVSPWKTGLGKRTSVIPRLATVVPSVVSYTVMPTRMPSVYMLLNSRSPHSVWAAKCASRCSGCGFMVSRLNMVLSISVTVRDNG